METSMFPGADTHDHTDTARLVELNAAYHEIGHGLAAKTGGLHVDHCKLIRGSDGVAATGVTRIDVPEPGAPVELWDAFAVFLFAGISAQTRHADEIGLLDRGVARRIEQAAAGDLEWWPQAARYGSLSQRQARREADRLVGRAWPRVGRLAVMLADTRHLAGGRL
jgi:hypothetical protein